MSAPRLPLLVLASTVFLTACAPTERADSRSPVEASAVNADAASPSRSPARPATVGPMRPVVDPLMGKREPGRATELRATERSGASVGAAASAAGFSAPLGIPERRTARDVGGATPLVIPSRRVGVRSDGSAALSTRAGLKAVEKGGAVAIESSAALPLAVVASAHPNGFTPEQMRVLIQMGESFLADTGAGSSLTSLTPNGGGAPLSAAEIWEASTQASDERFRAMFGYEAFNAMQLQRAREAYAEAKAQRAMASP